MKLYRLKSYEAFMAIRNKLDTDYGYITEREKALVPNQKKVFTVPGYSYTAGQCVAFEVNRPHAAADVNWRETLVCPVTKLNNRLRATYQFFEFELAPDSNSTIYLSEQTTQFYQFLKLRFPNVVGSEYLDPALPGGTINEEGIRHEDLTNLSFEKNSFDYCIALECFEHFPDFKKGFASCYSVLKEGGKLLLTVPFSLADKENITRAYVNESGKVIHLMEPEYHGNPIDPAGSLCFTHFGWEILEQLKESGFSDAYIILYWSEEFGYLGGHQLLIVATK